MNPSSLVLHQSSKLFLTILLDKMLLVIARSLASPFSPVSLDLFLQSSPFSSVKHTVQLRRVDHFFFAPGNLKIKIQEHRLVPIKYAIITCTQFNLLIRGQHISKIKCSQLMMIYAPILFIGTVL